MTHIHKFTVKAFTLLSVLITGASPAYSLTCGHDENGFHAWKQEFSSFAQTQGIQRDGLKALKNASYSHKTIFADRNQKGVRYELDDFIRIRLGSLENFARQAQKQKKKYPKFYSDLERAYGVQSGILLAIHGMETSFGRTLGTTPVVDSILTVTYDCRRSDFFKPHALAALKLIDQNALAANQLGAAHGEMGHTQFLPGNALKYGVDSDQNGRIDFYSLSDALASTAKFLRAKGWKPGEGYQEGTHNFRVLNEWNAATVYQQAIARSAILIDR